MLTSAEAVICARDPDLPGLRHLLEPKGLIARAGLGDRVPVYLRYKPRTSCVVALAPDDGSLDVMTAMAYPKARYAQVRARAEWQTGPQPALYFDDLLIVLVPLGLDRRIKGARHLANPVKRTAYLAALGLPDQIPTLLRYKPGRRLVLQVRTQTGGLALLKAHDKKGFRTAKRGARHATTFANAPHIVIDKKRRCIVSAWIAGAPLIDIPAQVEAFRETGAELAALHEAPARADLHRNTEAANLTANADMLACLLPGLAARARHSADKLVALLASLPDTTRVIHGDFSPDQIIMRDCRPVVIDWDRICLGDPGRDLGSFLASLDVDVINGVMTPQIAEAASKGLRDGYFARSGDLPASIRAHNARALMALIPEGFRQRRPNWSARADAILSRIDILLCEQTHNASKERTPGLMTACDPVAMRAQLVAALGPDVAQADITAQLLREKPGRRALVRYDIATDPPRAILAKLRVKRPDRRTPALHTALRTAGLDGRAPHFTGVPASLGTTTRPAAWLQPVIDGPTLTECLLAGSATAAAARAGQALARLHKSEVDCNRNWSLADEIGVLERALDLAKLALPDHQDALSQIARSARKAMDALPNYDAVNIHRDFYPDQVLISKGSTWLIDLDLFASGDRYIDLGNFLAHLTELGLRLHNDPGFFRLEAEAFLSGYSSDGYAISGPRLRTLHWISLARHINISRKFADRQHITLSLMKLFENSFARFELPTTPETCSGAAPIFL
jgi:Ser/Thr protein kinase RdoA (MazF antagonist)